MCGGVAGCGRARGRGARVTRHTPQNRKAKTARRARSKKTVNGKNARARRRARRHAALQYSTSLCF